MVYRSFYHQAHRFRDQVSEAYWAILWVARLAYPNDSESELDYKFGNETGLANISNMLVVYIWTLFEVYMREAFIAIHVNNPPDDATVRSRNKGWGQMREWLEEKKMFNEILRSFDSLIGEFCARRNCLVHNDGKVDKQYVNQVKKYGGSHTFSVEDKIHTDWKYHKALEDALVPRFNIALEMEVELYLRGYK